MIVVGCLVGLLLVGARLVLRPGLDKSKLVGFGLLGVCIVVCLVLMVGHVKPF